MNDRLLRLPESDLKLVEEVTRQLYVSEIDRKDKILASMSVVSGPVAILIASVAFLASTTMSSDADYLTTSPDIVVLIYDICAMGLVWFIVSAMVSFRLLLSAEYYSYLPDADQMISHFDEIASVVEQVGTSDETLFSRAARIRLIELYAETATANCKANDLRLNHRQDVFSRTTLAVLMVVICFLAVAVHRQRPHIWFPFARRGVEPHATSQHQPAAPGAANPPPPAASTSPPR